MQYNKIIVFWLFIFSVSFGKFDPKLMHFNTSDIDSNTKEITITFIVPEKDFIYKDFIHCSVHESNVTLSSWKEDKQSTDYYDPIFNETKKVFNETFSLTMRATIGKWNPQPVHLYCSYYRKSDKKMHHRLFTFIFAQPMAHNLLSEEVEDLQIIKPIIRHHTSLLDIYGTKLNRILYSFIDHINHYSSLYFGILIFLLICLFCTSSYFAHKLQKYPAIKDIIGFIQLSLSIIAIGYIQLHFIAYNHTQVSFCWLSTVSFGYLYIKKSTQTQLRALGTFCTFFGILLIAGSFIVLFKAVQF